ncbi:hypothetical protein scyTo_0012135, partial [Scyliorhinus torazame]|nr:hypothetical protein [Scyliorhinus torazame]
ESYSHRLNDSSHIYCPGMWDNITCWPNADYGDVISVSCPGFFRIINTDDVLGIIYRNCTDEGWSETFPHYYDACGVDENITEIDDQDLYYVSVKALYTVGYSTSLISLVIAMIILCRFRKLHCTRNYIHMNLFVSFILRAISVFIKDAILYSEDKVTHCSITTVSTPTICVTVWTVLRLHFDDSGCWETNEHRALWWIIKGPVIASIMVNFILFIGIIFILVQKLQSPDIGGNESSIYFCVQKCYCKPQRIKQHVCKMSELSTITLRLARSTLLLIPLFGIHYTVFAFYPEDVNTRERLVFELGLGSFQVTWSERCNVAERAVEGHRKVQSEIKRKWRSWKVNRYFAVDFKHRHPSLASSGANGGTQLSVLSKSSSQIRMSGVNVENLAT